MFAGRLSRRVGFFINAPIGLALAAAAPRVLPETTPRPGRLVPVDLDPSLSRQ
jgi:hypothetical protein